MQVWRQVRLQASQMQVWFILHEVGLYVFSSCATVQVPSILHETSVSILSSGCFHSSNGSVESAGKIYLATARLSELLWIYKFLMSTSFSGKQSSFRLQKITLYRLMIKRTSHKFQVMLMWNYYSEIDFAIEECI